MQSNDNKPLIPQDDLGDRIRQLPYDTPGPDLTRRIMADIRRKKANGFRGLLQRVRSPMTVSMSPLMASVLVLAVFAAGGIVYHQAAGRLAPGPTPNRAGQGVPVVFHLQDPSAKSVAVMGSFNNWDPEGYEMTQDPDTGLWSLQLNLDAGRHEYVFWVDNQRIAPDPGADLVREDDFGNRNSVLFITDSPAQSI